MFIALWIFVLIILLLVLPFLLFVRKRYFRICSTCQPNAIKVQKNVIIFNEKEKQLILNKLDNKVVSTYFSSGKKVMVKDVFPQMENNLKNLIERILKQNIHIGDSFFRLYNSDNDHIDWHYDGNHTKGKKYTFVFLIDKNDCNSSEFQYKDQKTSVVNTIDMDIDDVVYYEGDSLFHRITDQQTNCYRLVMVCPVYTDLTPSILGYFEKGLLDLSSKLNIHI
jgi:hypothetical protein